MSRVHHLMMEVSGFLIMVIVIRNMIQSGYYRKILDIKCDFFSNQFTTKIFVASTVKTEEIEFNGELYPKYPYIREELLGVDTSNLFIDTLRFSNCYLAGCGGDYDGDQATCKGVYTDEANEELENFMNSKENFITFGCAPLRDPGSDVIQSLYAVTKVLSTTNITPSDDIKYA